MEGGGDEPRIGSFHTSLLIFQYYFKYYSFFSSNKKIEANLLQAINQKYIVILIVLETAECECALITLTSILYGLSYLEPLVAPFNQLFGAIGSI